MTGGVRDIELVFWSYWGEGHGRGRGRIHGRGHGWEYHGWDYLDSADLELVMVDHQGCLGGFSIVGPCYFSMGGPA